MPRCWLLVGVGLLACYGCVGLRGGMLSQLDPDEIVRGSRLPAISYQIRHSGRTEPGPGYESEQLFCSAFVDARRGFAADDDLHIELCFRAEEDLPVLSIGLRVLYLFSLGIIPAYSQDELSLRARVEFKGRLLREYSYEDRITTWANLLLIPWAYTSNNALRVREQMHANMLLHLIRELRKDLPAIVPLR